MTTQSYQQLIMQGIHGLPSDTLAEIVDFIYFLRKRGERRPVTDVLQPKALEEEREAILLRNDLKQLSLASVAHLEKEFAGYEELYPKE